MRDRSPGGGPGPSFGHCALVDWVAGTPTVIEAVFPRVCVTPVWAFLGRSLDRDGDPAAVAARLRRRYRHLIPRALRWAEAHVGVPYDEWYRPGDNALYCSELVVCAFRAANDRVDVFREEPMSFSGGERGEVPTAWARHFARLGITVPEGVIGSGPATLWRAPALQVVHRFGGWPTPLAAVGSGRLLAAGTGR
jgi:hypothetical protein